MNTACWPTALWKGETFKWTMAISYRYFCDVSQLKYFFSTSFFIDIMLWEAFKKKICIPLNWTKAKYYFFFTASSNKDYTNHLNHFPQYYHQQDLLLSMTISFFIQIHFIFFVRMIRNVMWFVKQCLNNVKRTIRP